MCATFGVKRMDTVVVFPHRAWESLPHRGLIERLGSKRTVYIVTDEKALDGAPPQFATLALDALDELNWEQIVAVVSHPDWLYEAAGRHPAALIALVPAELEHGERDYVDRRDELCALATIVIAGSEPFYFEQWFRRGAVFLADGLDTAADLLADAAACDVAASKSAEAIARLQLRRRVDFRAEQLKQLRPSAMQYFFQAVYHYLLGEAEAAEKWTLDAFHLAAMSGEADALRMYYRFLSAVRLLQGREQDAIATFSVSAVSDEDRAADHELSVLHAAGEKQLAAALLYRLNDDYRRAGELLVGLAGDGGAGSTGQGKRSLSAESGLLSGKAGDANADSAEQRGRSLLFERDLLGRNVNDANAGSAEQRARSLLAEVRLRSGKPGEALALLDSPRTVADRLERQLLAGRAFALAGLRHEAVATILQAAMIDIAPLTAIADIARADNAARQLAKGGFA